MSAPSGWSQDTELLASAVDALRLLRTEYHNVNFEPKITEPFEPVRRPYLELEPVETNEVPVSQLAAALED